jgi:hypothetical protein
MFRNPSFVWPVLNSVGTESALPPRRGGSAAPDYPAPDNKERP